MNETVFVVSRGENNSGGSVAGVRRNYDDAVALALSQDIDPKCGKEWINVFENRWECGCDYVQVEMFELS